MNTDEKKAASVEIAEDDDMAAVPPVEVKDLEAGTGEKRELPKALNYVAKALLAIMAAYHLFAAGYRALPSLQHCAVHLGLGIAIIMLFYPTSKKTKNSKAFLIMDVVLAVFAIVSMFYVMYYYTISNQRFGFPATTIEIVLGIGFIAMLFVAARRTMGWIFPIIGGIFVAYMFLGPHLPGLWFHTGITINRFVSVFYLSVNGIYGSITKTSADVIILFIMFSSIVKYSPIGDFIMDVATSLFGGFRGGPAKVACMSSGLMGMLSGSAVANVAGTGCITIPMMKKAGYPGKFAGAVEAAASTGGQIMPPVMGGSVFILVELVGTTYNHVLLIALPIAIMYYIGLLLSIDLKAVNMNLRGLSADEKPSFGKTLKEGWYLALPVIVLVAMLANSYSAQKSGFWAIVTAIAVSFISPKNRMTPKRLFEALTEGVKDATVIFAVVGIASLIQGVVGLSGLGLRLSSIMVELAAGRILLLLILTAVTSIILGMGLPVIVCYSFLALLIAPGMVKLGIPMIAAHMFIFYYGCLSCITPPVAMASLVAAGIAKSKPMETGLEACKVAFSIFFVPFFFVYRTDVLLEEGFTPQALLSYAMVLIGLYATSAGFNGALLPSIKIHSKVWQVLLVIAGVIILVPVANTFAIGGALLAVVHIILVIGYIRNRSRPEPASI